MKSLLFICCAAAVLLVSCKKTEQPAPEQPKSMETQAPPTEPSPIMKEFFSKTDKKEFKDPKRAIELYATIPVGGPIPPNFLPIEELHQESKDENMIVYTFNSGSTKQHGKIVMRKVVTTTDTLWSLESIGAM